MIKILQSYRTMITLLVLYAAAMAAATIVESRYSTLVARTYFYTSWWFIALQIIMCANFIAISLKSRIFSQKKWGVLALHYALIVILIGAMVTHLTAQEGVMHIREGETSNKLYDPQSGQLICELPFGVTLNDFRLVRYPGSGSPSSYESDVTIEGEHRKIYMNNIAYKNGYRLYQSSYDPDEKGTVLSVNRDAAGTIITYLGYLLLTIGLILSLLHKNSHFRRLIRSLSVVAVLFLMISPSTASEHVSIQHPLETASATHDSTQTPINTQPTQTTQSPAEGALALEYAQKAALSTATADQFGKLLVQTSDGRIEPVDTYAGKLLRKIAREKTFAGLSANQVVLGMVIYPEIWSRVPIIKSGSQKIAFVDVIDSQGNYIHAAEVEHIYEKPVSKRTKSDKDLLKLDERVNIMHALMSGQMLPIFPNTVDPAHKWYSPADDLSSFVGKDSMFVSRVFVWFGNEVRKNTEGSQVDKSGNAQKTTEIIGMIGTYQHAKAIGVDIDKDRIEAEIFYNKADIFKWSGFAYMGLGFVMLIILIINLLNDTKTLRIIITIFTILITGVFLCHSFGIGLRWYIAARAPMSNGYETMVYVGWATALAGLLFTRRSKVTLALGAIFAGVILFVSNLNFMDPEITSLVPVLKSYWLMIHVAVITGSYGFFGIGFLLGIVSLILMCIKGDKLNRQITELHTINQLALTIGLVLLTIGTFLGAVWANESWGRYWGWDPKETWALITVIVYAVIVHSYLIPGLRSAYSFAVMSIIGMGSVLMTYFGVNYYLSGLHSYGSDSAPGALTVIYIVYGVIAVLAIYVFVRKRLESHCDLQP